MQRSDLRLVPGQLGPAQGSPQPPSSRLHRRCDASRLRLAALPPAPQYGSDVVPLLRKLKYDAKFEPAFRQVVLGPGRGSRGTCR